MRRSVNETNCRRIGTISCVMSTQFYGISWNKCINKWQKITRKESALGPSQLSSAQSLIPFPNPDKFLDTGWQRPRGCLKLQVIFRKRAANYRALLRKCIMKTRHFMGLRYPVWTKHECVMSHMSNRTHAFWLDSFFCVTWLFLLFDMTLSFVWHDSFFCVCHDAYRQLRQFYYRVAKTRILLQSGEDA